MNKNVPKNRILLKLSGEYLMGDKKLGYDPEILRSIANQLNNIITQKDIELSVVVGAGNIWRGREYNSLSIDRVDADHMGILATVMNAIALKNAILNTGCKCIIQSAISVDTICQEINIDVARDYANNKTIVIFAGGTGNPFFTTDTAAVLRAIEMKCDYLLKGTNVDGVYNTNPNIDNNAIRYNKISYSEIIKSDLKIMDMSAIAMAMEYKLPIKVFSIREEENLERVINEKGIFTKIGDI